MERYRIVEGVGLYYVTFTVIERLPVFVDEIACKILTNSLNFCIQKKNLEVNAYVIMLTHLHAFLFDVEFDPARLKSTLDDMRKFTGRQLLDHAGHLPKSFTEEFQNHAGKDVYDLVINKDPSGMATDAFVHSLEKARPIVLPDVISVQHDFGAFANLFSLGQNVIPAITIQQK